jgi:putative heme uptake system protein
MNGTRDRGRRTFILVDGENIDATLGGSVLGRRPAPEERPRWERVTDYAAALWDQPVVGLFFLNASQGHLPTPFIQALLALGYRPIPLAGSGDQKVVDIGIQRTLAALVDRDDDVLLCSHDADFAPQMRDLIGGDRRLGLLGFREFASTHLTGLGLHLHDLEDDVDAFQAPLPRVRVIPLEDFDPELFLR